MVMIWIVYGFLSTADGSFSVETPTNGRLFVRCAGPELAGFLLSPFRKPKRVRTAFSPSQLLKLEHAFEKNHYVVGAERKQLAQALNLTETQVQSGRQPSHSKNHFAVEGF